MSSTSTATPLKARAFDALAQSLRLPAWLAPRLDALGGRWWHRVTQADARGGLRWLALNWSRVAAWWLTIGLGLSALFLLVALLTWQNPQLMFAKLIGWGVAGLGTGGKLVGWGALVVLLLSLPLILPALLLAGVTVATGAAALVMFAPVLLLGVVAFAVLLVVATGKRFGLWLSSFIVGTLADSDQRRNLARLAGAMLGVHGNAVNDKGQVRWLEGADLRRFLKRNQAAPKGAPVFLGYVDGKPLSVTTEKHLYMTAPTRAGKGRDLIIPNLMRYPASVFVLDPKGENCLLTAAAREAMGHTVAAFDPDGLTGRPAARFNPLAVVDPDDMVTAADYLGEALIIGADDHWNESARGLIRALALHLITAPEDQLGGRARDLPALRELLTGYLDVTLEAMQQSEALDGLVARLAESFVSIPPNERGGIVSTARRGTKWLDNRRMADLFRAGEGAISFADLRDESKRLSVFVCLPSDKFGTYPQVCRILTTFAMDTVMRSLTGRRQPVVFLLDELAQLQRLPIVERAFTLGAGFGLQVWAVFQSAEQAKKLYSLDTLYGSSGIRLFFKIEDPESCAYASQCASELLNPAQVRALGEYETLTLLDGAPPLVVTRMGAYLPPQGDQKAAERVSSAQAAS